MNLREIRKKLVELSGFYDLVVNFHEGDYSNNGADFFINSGLRWLDSQLNMPNDEAQYKVTVESGNYSVLIPNSRALQAIRVSNPDEGTGYLDRMTKERFFDRFTDEDKLEDLDKGKPWAYTIETFRRATSMSEMEMTFKKVLFAPPADEEYTLIFEGLYYTPELKEEEDFNWWSVMYPDLLIEAALYKREVFFRNRSGAADWRDDILRALAEIDNDVVEEEAAEVDALMDAWSFRERTPTRVRHDSTQRR